MFELENRIIITNKILDSLVSILKNVSYNDRLNGLYVFIFHWLILGVPLIKILIGEIDGWFILSCFIWLIIFIFHVYFNGCILTRLERRLWNTKDWYGPWCLPFKLIEIYTEKKLDNSITNTIFYYWAIFLISYVMIKIYINIKN